MSYELIVTKISGRGPNSFLVAENESHRVRFAYFGNYEKAIDNNRINPDDLFIQVKPKAINGGFGINFTIQNNLTNQSISILGSDFDYCGEEG